MTDELLTIEEAARLAHVSRETIRYWIKTGRLTSVPIRMSARSGRPYGQLIKKAELATASATGKLKQLQESHPGKLLTINQMCSTLGISRELGYRLLRRYNLEKHYIDGCQYVIDVDLLWQYIEEDPEYWYIAHFKKLERNSATRVKLT